MTCVECGGLVVWVDLHTFPWKRCQGCGAIDPEVEEEVVEEPPEKEVPILKKRFASHSAKVEKHFKF